MSGAGGRGGRARRGGDAASGGGSASGEARTAVADEDAVALVGRIEFHHVEEAAGRRRARPPGGGGGGADVGREADEAARRVREGALVNGALQRRVRRRVAPARHRAARVGAPHAVARRPLRLVVEQQAAAQRGERAPLEAVAPHQPGERELLEDDAAVVHCAAVEAVAAQPGGARERVVVQQEELAARAAADGQQAHVHPAALRRALDHHRARRPQPEVEALGAAAPPHDVRAARRVDLQQHAAAERREPRVLDADRAGVHRLGRQPRTRRARVARVLVETVRPSRGAVKQQLVLPEVDDV